MHVLLFCSSAGMEKQAYSNTYTAQLLFLPTLHATSSGVTGIKTHYAIQLTG